MLVYDLDGNSSILKIPNRCIKPKRKTSMLHAEARKIITASVVCELYEEVPIKIKKRTTLYLDFYLKSLNTAIEVHGAQHYKFSALYHKTKMDFFKQKKNDQLKQEWCEINKIRLVVFPFDQQDMWKDMLYGH